MIAIDTNVIVRFLTRVDEGQFRRARNLIRREAESGDPVLISHKMLLETEWVRRSGYGLDKNEILSTFSDLLAAADLTFEDESSVEEALVLWRDFSAQFADCLIGARHRALGCRATASFDTNALKLPTFTSV
jgi:predicted nucleic-acid-binding protein